MADQVNATNGVEANAPVQDTNAALLAAVEKGDLETVKNVLKRGPINKSDNRALKVAKRRYETNDYGQVRTTFDKTEDRYEAITEVLLEHGFFSQWEDFLSEKMLCAAVAKGKTKLVELFLKQGFDVNKTYGLGASIGRKKLLRIAVEKKQADVVKLLIKYGGDVNIQSRNGKSLLSLAMPKVETSTPLGFRSICRPLGSGNFAIAKLLLESNVNARKDNNLLIAAVGNMQVPVDIIELLLARGVNVNAQDKQKRTALHLTTLATDPLKLAKEDNDRLLKIAKLLLRHGANLNIRSRFGFTALHFAVIKGLTKLVEVLLENNRNVDINVDGVTPLHIASFRNNAVMCELLLKRRASLNVKLADESTELHVALRDRRERSQVKEVLSNYHIISETCADINMHKRRQSIPFFEEAPENLEIEDCKPVVELLVKFGVNVNARGLGGKAPLITAIQNPRPDIGVIELLLTKGAKVNDRDESGKTPLMEACEYKVSTHANNYAHRHIRDSRPIVELLIKFGANVNAPNDVGKTPLLFAIQDGGYFKTGVIELLLKNGVDVNVNDESGKTPLMKAIECQFTMDLVRKFISHGAQVDSADKNGSTALHMTAAASCIETVKELVLCGAQANSRDESGRTPLHVAKEAHIIEVLLESGAEVNAQDIHGNVPLHSAREKKSAENLIKHGAKIDATDKQGRTPLHRALLDERVYVAEVLLNAGAKVKTTDIEGNTPLHAAVAIREDFHHMAEELLEKGAEVNKRNICGESPLHVATKNDSFCRNIKLLLTFGASVSSADLNGQTALHIASEEGAEIPAKLLLSFGADINALTSDGRTPLDFAITRKAAESRRNTTGEERFSSYHRSCFDILTKEIVQAKAANMFVHSRDWLQLKGDSEVAKFRKKCEAEVDMIKSETIGESNTTLYAFLRKSKNQLARFMTKNNVKQSLQSKFVQYPVYSTMITRAMDLAKKRASLLDQGEALFATIFDGIPDECSDMLLEYLCNGDLESFVKACNPDDLTSS